MHSKHSAESIIVSLPPFGSIGSRDTSGFSGFQADESLRRTGLHLSLSAKSSFYLPAVDIPRSCRTASEVDVLQLKGYPPNLCEKDLLRD